MKLAVVGTGIAGLTAAHLLAPRHDLTVYEADAWRHPAAGAQVGARIYWQAALLKLKGAPYHPHPERG
jgi:glycine/D-amino acid oxidase-like deaminating enzyme